MLPWQLARIIWKRSGPQLSLVTTGFEGLHAPETTQLQSTCASCTRLADSVANSLCWTHRARDPFRSVLLTPAECLSRGMVSHVSISCPMMSSWRFCRVYEHTLFCLFLRHWPTCLQKCTRIPRECSPFCRKFSRRCPRQRTQPQGPQPRSSPKGITAILAAMTVNICNAAGSLHLLLPRPGPTAHLEEVFRPLVETPSADLPL